MFRKCISQNLYSIKGRVCDLITNQIINSNAANWITFRNITDDVCCSNLMRGIDYLKQANLNKGLAFTLEERQSLGIQGLIAANVKTQEEQLAICTYSVDRYKNPLNKYLYLTELQDTNEKLFYELLATNIEKYLPLVYTPVVGLACQRFGLVYRRPRGLFITIHDKGRVSKILRNWPERDVRAIVVTDGERILGLGDLGAYGMGIPVGKLTLYTALAGVPPTQCLPITLDVGTNNQMLLEDPMYIGLRQNRVRGKEFDDFIEEFMVACTEIFTHNVLIQFEDFALSNAARLLAKYKEFYCTFNDDIQGTAGVIIAGMLAATRITKKKLSEQKYLFLGAGSAGVGIANLLCEAMVEEGVTIEAARNKIYLFDLDGLLSTKRSNGIPPHATQFGKDMEPTKDFAGFVASEKPTCLIGVSTSGGAFTPEILKQMAQNAERPLIFALSNPTMKAECTPQQAYDHTEGRCIYASGSPFPPVKYGGREYRTGQGNNSYVFPGVGLGALACFAHHVPDSMFLTAAKSLANSVSEKDLELGRVYPPLNDIRRLSLKIAEAIVVDAYNLQLASIYPKPKNIAEFVRSYEYKSKYSSYKPDMYKYPDLPNIKVKSIEEMLAALYRHVHKGVCINCSAFTKQQQGAQFSLTAPRLSVSGDVISTNLTKGIDHLRDPRLNKGLAFTLAERQAYGIHGLLSSEFRTLEQQVEICKLSVNRYRSLLNKFLYLSELQDTNETLFYTLLSDNIDKFMPLINIPTVGLACMRFGLVYKKARGLFISIHDRGHVIDVLKNWPERDVRVIVVTDGERVLGLGDLGAHGMGIPQSKIVLLTALAGIKPHQCLPVCLDTGTNNQGLLEDPLYIGIRETRAIRNDYDELVGEFMGACKKLYGPQTLVMMEDFALHNAYRLLNRFRDDFCVFNDDIQATAAAVVAGLMVACNKITKQNLKDNAYLFYGAGSTGVGIANLLCDAMMEEGLSSEAARNRCYMFDIDGLLSSKRSKAIPKHAKDYARDLEPEMDFEKCIKKFKATCLIGTSTCGSAFTPIMLRELAKNTERPLIFSLSNPTHQSECTPQEAYDNTDGRCIFASGSPFPPVKYNGHSYKTGQANNYYIFPGLALGVVAGNAFRVTDAMFLTAAKTLARNVTEADIKLGRIYPPVNDMRNVSLSIAADIVSLAYDQQLTFLCPKPQDILAHVKNCLYKFKYQSNLPKFYAYPDNTKVVKLKKIEVLHRGLLPNNRRPRPELDKPLKLM